MRAAQEFLGIRFAGGGPSSRSEFGCKGVRRVELHALRAVTGRRRCLAVLAEALSAWKADCHSSAKVAGFPPAPAPAGQVRCLRPSRPSPCSRRVSANLDPCARAIDLKGIGGRHINRLRSVEIVVVGDIAGVAAVQRGEVAVIGTGIATAIGVVHARLDVLANYVHAVPADLGGLQFTHLGLDRLLLLCQRGLLLLQRRRLLAESGFRAAYAAAAFAFAAVVAADTAFLACACAAVSWPCRVPTWPCSALT